MVCKLYFKKTVFKMKAEERRTEKSKRESKNPSWVEEKYKKCGWLLEAEKDPWLTTKEMTASVIKALLTNSTNCLSMPRSRLSPEPQVEI